MERHLCAVADTRTDRLGELNQHTGDRQAENKIGSNHPVILTLFLMRYIVNINERREKIQKYAGIGLICIAGLVVSPIIFMAITGLIGLVVAALIGLAIVTFAPWVSMKFANWRVKAIVSEARENPIETMINLLAAKRQAFKEFQINVTTAVTARNGFKTKIEAFAKKYPARAVEFQTQLENMTDLVERKKKALVVAEKMLEDGQLKLEEMQAYWDMSQAAQAANKAAGMDTGDMFERLKADTACDAVFESMNRAFAELEVAATLDVDAEVVDNNPKLMHNVNVVDLTAVQLKEKVR